MKTLFGLIYPTIMMGFLILSTASYATVYTYDELHRLTQVTDPSGSRLDYRYDPAGNLLKITASQVTSSLIYHLLVGTIDSQVLIRSPEGLLEHDFTVNPNGSGTMIAAINSDNTTQIAVASQNAITLYDLQGIEQRTFPVITTNATLASGDFNQDNQPEIAVASQVNPSRNAFLYSLTGSLFGEIPLFQTETLFSLAAGDVDKEGHDDLIAGNLQANEISVNGRFTFPVFSVLQSDSPNSSANKVTICHRPPGQPTAAQTLTVSKNALTAHLNHGDTLGACTPPVYGVNVAVSDLEGDGQAEIIVAMARQGSQIEIYRGETVNGLWIGNAPPQEKGDSLSSL